MEIETLNEIARKLKLQHLEEEIQALARPSIRLLASPANSSDLQIGGSRLGGQPDLPEGFQWPTKPSRSRREIPMAFVAQICLEDIAGLAPAQDLPASGTLSFFYDSTQETYGIAPDDRGGWNVNFFEPAAPLQQVAYPGDLPPSGRFSPLALRFHNELTLPANPQQEETRRQWSEKDLRGYEDLLKALHGPGDRKLPHHRMFGWPEQIQDDMQSQAEMLAGHIPETGNFTLPGAVRSRVNWELLLQVDSDERAGMRWGSYGRLYYWITEQALQARQFQQTWLILQSD